MLQKITIKKLQIQSLILILLFLMFGCSNKKIEDVAVSKDGVEISFEKKGKSKPAIIFIHGWTNPRTIWEDQVEHFSKNYTAIAIDLAGSGKSGNNRTNWTIEAFSNDVIAVIDKLKLDKVVLVGFSMGASVVIETTNRIPDKVLGVVTVDALQKPGRQVPKEMIPVIIDRMMSMERTNENLVAGGFYKRNEEASFERITKIYEGASTIGWKESLENAIRWMNNNQKTSLQKLQVPFRGIFSDKEPVEIDSIKKYVPSFKADIIPETGHLVFWDEPEKFNELLEKDIKEFLK
ncbi:MAG TPA: alpha/beta hydrolase [Flavobacteriaceae bacterium]|nr:alpha/beta hydrolase [Flavobacteriaceae bacterium]